VKHRAASTLTVFLSLTTLLAVIIPTLGDTQLTTHLNDDWAPSITQTKDGRVWVVWHSTRNQTGNIDLYYRTYNGSAWSNETQLTTHPNTDGLPSIIQTKDATIWVVWTSNRNGNYDIFYKTSSNNGASWSSETQLTTDTNDDKDPTILQAADGKLWVVWQTHRTGNDDLFYKTSSDNGASWSSENQLTTDTNDDRHPSIMQASNGTVWVVWSSFRINNNFDLFFTTTKDNGLSWSAQAQLTTDTGPDTFPSLMQAKDGNIWVAWETDRNIQDDIYYKIYNGSTWTPENQLTWFMYDDIQPSIFQAADQTTWLAWASDKFNNYDIFYKFVIIDIKIKNVTTSSTTVDQGSPLEIYVDPKNEGTAGATFDVTAYVDDNPIGTQQRKLIPSEVSNTLVFTWNTTGVPPGYYTMSARVPPVLGERDTADNTFVDGTVGVFVHDVAVKNVTASRALVQQGYTPEEISVEVKNEGTATETFTVTVYANSTQLGTRSVTLTPDSSTTLTFAWQTTYFIYGNYRISARASQVTAETDLSDNSLTDGTVVVTIPGDINGDRSVNILDAGAVSNHWYPGPPVGPSGYDPNADVNCDGKVSIVDLAIINGNWLRTW